MIFHRCGNGKYSRFVSSCEVEHKLSDEYPVTNREWYVSFDSTGSCLELMVRLSKKQLGMPLQPAERMAAHVGPWALFATTIKQEYLSEGSQLLEYWGVETSRARDFQYAAQIIMGIYTLPARCSFTTPVLDKWLQRQDPPTEKFKRQIRELFDRYMAVGPFNVQKVISPVEFVMITILIKLHPNANEAKLGELISEFRTKLKRNHVDLRTNNKVLKTAYDIIEGQL